MGDSEWENDGENICQDVLDRVGVLRGEGHGSGEPVMLFVDALVDLWMVECAMEGVEEDFTNGEGVDEVGDNRPERGVLRANGEERVLKIGVVVHRDVEDGGGYVSDRDLPDAFFDSGPARLSSFRLELVPVGEVGKGQIQSQV